MLTGASASMQSARLSSHRFSMMSTPSGILRFRPRLRLSSTVSRRYLSWHPSSSSPIQQLSRVKELQERVSGVNSKDEKARIIAEYPDLKDLLEHVYDPIHRTHLSSSSLARYIDTTSSHARPKPDVLSLTHLFDALSSRRVTGNNAKALVASFLQSYGVLDGEEEDLRDTFDRLLDRNLVAGFGARTLSTVPWPAQKEEEESSLKGPVASPLGSSPTSLPTRTLLSTSTSLTSSSRSLEAFSCALGKTITPPFDSLFSSTGARSGTSLGSGTRWYASRKLDGVRCITFLDFDVSLGTSIQPRLVKVQHLSRTGKPFSTLGNLRPQLELISEWSGLRRYLEIGGTTPSEDAEGDNLEAGAPSSMTVSVQRRLVLDGEVCVMVPSRHPQAGAPTPTTSSTSSFLWPETELIEDFPSTISAIRRHNHTIDRPAYYLFDILTYAEFSIADSLKGKGGSAIGSQSGSLGKTFGQRAADLQDLGRCIEQNQNTHLQQDDYLAVKPLKQKVVNDVREVEGMVDVAAREGWEGLVLRADKEYREKRSNDIRKFKQWQDAEYTVTALNISRQRLPIQGVYGEHEAVAALVVKHKGFEVAVGSGMSVAQRISWAREPEKIVGKQITVEYFSETEAQDRKGVLSLRFPRIKAVWDGQRDV